MKEAWKLMALKLPLQPLLLGKLSTFPHRCYLPSLHSLSLSSTVLNLKGQKRLSWMELLFHMSCLLSLVLLATLSNITRGLSNFVSFLKEVSCHDWPLLSLSSIFSIAISFFKLLKCNLHMVKFALLSAVLWVLGNMYNRVTTTMKIYSIAMISKRPLMSLCCLHFLFSAFSRKSYKWHQMVWFWAFWISFLLLRITIGDSSILLHVSEVSSFLLLSGFIVWMNYSLFIH